MLKIGRRTGLEKTMPSAQFFDNTIVQVTIDGKTFFSIRHGSASTGVWIAWAKLTKGHRFW